MFRLQPVILRRLIIVNLRRQVKSFATLTVAGAI